ncbi:Glycosyltransferase involved in cell wall bisynthesis [Zunongwangia mangrovi]|uniref:Glycosyltransferase involved in cell wall bisynthesis n=1 Tax=Zunongwangia mangrovi TaxID=1334022 RepID=A0A1I1LW01_9FLAO|nr:glycosyltransferase [Zunongwangia mangrovi]SFC74503.1 Glycosyltransferase involved in cell wall bisynthesis [Zunongwangia mangrovi]
MNFLIITHVPHSLKNNQYLGYAPYFREMNMWFKYVEKVKVVAPLQLHETSALVSAYKHSNLNFVEVPRFSIVSLKEKLLSILKLPLLIFQISKAMIWADHIHLRCPGNMGLLGCLVQIFFPSKAKTVKYAGNWEPNSKQPLSYKLQKWIVSNTLLSKNIKVLTYGKWPNQTKNIIPFFTASFSEVEIEEVEKNFSGELKFLFVGSLVEGKQPLYAIRLVEKLKNSGRDVSLKIFGEGPLRPDLENYIQTMNLSTCITVCGGVPLDQLKDQYKRSHFSILPSKSEGWPKAVAEAMFFGCIPVATRVSCVPWMLENGKRGILLNEELEKDLTKLNEVLENRGELQKMATEAMNWSQHYTVEYFEKEIKNLL